MQTYAIGDIHGCHSQLVYMLDKIDAHSDGAPHRIITLGDYIDRGPDSRQVLDTLMLRPDIVTLRGNHEQMLLDVLDFPDHPYAADDFLHNGGWQTLQSFGVGSVYQIPLRYIDFMRSTVLWTEDEFRYFVHAGIDPAKAMNNQDPNDLMWIRDVFLDHTADFCKYVVHGHTPVDGKVDIPRNRTNVDVHCYKHGELAAAVLNTVYAKPCEVFYVNSSGTIRHFKRRV